MAGEVIDNGATYPAGSYLVFAAGSSHRPRSPAGATIMGVNLVSSTESEADRPVTYADAGDEPCAPQPPAVRRWIGWIRPADRSRYQRHLEATGLAGYRSTPGNVGAWAGYRDLEDGRCEVTTVSLWRSRADIVGFAGERIERAVFYPADDDYLIGRELSVVHYDIGAASGYS